MKVGLKMKYSLDRNVSSSYYFDAMQAPYLVETKLKALFTKLDFLKEYRIKSKIDKDGLYSFHKDSFTFNLTIKNNIYVAHILEDGEKIEDIIQSYVPLNFDVYFNITYEDS